MLDALLNVAFASPISSVLILLVILYVTYEFRRKSDLPPGPYGLPFFGYIFHINPSKTSQQLGELCKRYKTDILSVELLGMNMIVLNTFDLIKECHQKRTDFTDRLSYNFFAAIEPGFTGVINSSGTEWREARRFSIRMLRDFGMGRMGAEEQIQELSRNLVEVLNAENGKACDPKDAINVAVSNIICGMVFGKRFENDDPEFRDALAGMNKLISELNSLALFLAMRYEFAQKYIVRNKFQACQEDFNRIAKFVRKQISEHKQSYNGEVTDLIHGYLKEMELGNNADIFDEKMLESLIIDYFIAGSETTFTTLRWCLINLAAFPELQRKVQDELDQEIGDRDVKMSDKKQTPYTEAFLCEIQRHYTLTPIGVAHSNLHEDVELNGYRIPKNSLVSANMREVHHSNDWKNPNEFDPNNFLENGRLENLEKLISFGIGRRSCAGEALARMEMYIFFATLVKEFDVMPETDQTVPDLDGISVGIYQPKPFKVRMRCRKRNDQ